MPMQCLRPARNDYHLVSVSNHAKLVRIMAHLLVVDLGCDDAERRLTNINNLL